MALKNLSESPVETRLERILIYSDPKCGKTRLATSLPEHFGESIYVAWDPGTEHLGPVLPQYRSRLHPIQSVPKKGETYAPDQDAFAIALMNWQEKFPKVRTLIWDHMSATAEDCLAFIADSSQFSKSHVAIGAPGSAGKLNLPMEGDYGAVHGTIDRLTTFLFRQPLHLIVLAHANMAEVRGEGLVGGPATVGKASIRKYPGRFDSVIHLARKKGEKGERYVAYTDKHDGLWIAGVRSHLSTNPMPSLDLSPDPINFWNTYLQHFTPLVPSLT